MRNQNESRFELMVDFLRRLTFKTANLPYVFRIVFGCFRVVFGSFSARFGPFSHRFAWFSHRFFRFFGVVVVARSFSSIVVVVVVAVDVVDVVVVDVVVGRRR